MNFKRTALALAASGGIGLTALTAGSGIASASTTPTPAAATTTPTPAAATTAPSAQVLASPWAPIAQGRPQFKAGSELGYYIWHDSSGWHLEVTHPTHDHVVFSGYVTTDGTLRVRRVDDERNDIVGVGPERHLLSFAFNNYGYIDGAHFWTSGASKLTFHLFVDGHAVAPASVGLGAHAANPLDVPFTLARTGA